MKPYYQDATTTPYLGAALEIMPALQLEGRAFAFTDPPYNVGHDLRPERERSRG